MQRDDQLAANRSDLDTLPQTKAIAENVQVCNTSRITGSVRIGKDSVIDNCIVRGPAVIGCGCQLKDAYVGPYTTLGDHVEIVATEIENSIVCDHASIRDVKDRIQDSVVGERACITRLPTAPARFRFCIGADDRVEIPAMR